LQVRSKERPRLSYGKTEQFAKLDPSVSKKKKDVPSISLRTARKRVVENISTGQVSGFCKILNNIPVLDIVFCCAPTTYYKLDFFKTSQGNDENEKHETEQPKKRGRERKLKLKAGHTLKKDDLSGNSDEAEDSRKRRPSRHRRKPNWIDENYVTGFKNKRIHRDGDDIDSEYAQPKNQSRPSSRAGQSRSPSGTQPKCVKSANSRRSTPIEPSSAIPGIQSEASSEETSNSSTPAPNENAYSVASNSHELNDGAVQSPLPLSSTGAECAKDIMTKKTCRLQYTSRPRRMKHGDDLLSDGKEMASKGTRGQTTSASTNVASGDGRPASQSRRKQDLSTIRENNDEVMIVRYSNGEASLPKDLSEIPVYLTETQRDLFFSFIRPASPSNDGASNTHNRIQCGDIIASISVSLTNKNSRKLFGVVPILILEKTLLEYSQVKDKPYTNIN
uniref:Bromo domain-containing protein n=1 Tax=Brugia pahangi TaxID=6280 RepID=A0A0N4T3J1_BRUPA